jgi:hypothetical protein
MNTSTEEDTLPTSDEKLDIINENILLAVKKFHDLPDNKKALLIGKHPDLPEQVQQLLVAMDNSRFTTNTNEHGRSKTSEFSLSGAEDNSNSSASVKTEPKKLSIRQLPGHSQLPGTQNLNSEDVGKDGTTITSKIPERYTYDLDLQMSLDDSESATLAFCNQLVQADLCTKLRNFADEISQLRWNNSLAFLAPDGLSQSIKGNENNDRITTINNLMDNIQKYELPKDKLRLFIKIWDIVSLADLVEPYWTKHCKRNKVRHKTPGAYENWAHYIWTKDWTKTLRRNNLPKMDEVVAIEWAKKMVEGRYWQHWCNTLSGGSDIKHLGALLLILVAVETKMEQDNRMAPPEQIFKAKELKGEALGWAETYLSTAQPRIREIAKVLNHWALQLYQKGLDKQEVEDFETSQRKIEGGTQNYANVESQVDGDL